MMALVTFMDCSRPRFVQILPGTLTGLEGSQSFNRVFWKSLYRFSASNLATGGNVCHPNTGYHSGGSKRRHLCPTDACVHHPRNHSLLYFYSENDISSQATRETRRTAFFHDQGVIYYGSIFVDEIYAPAKRPWNYNLWTWRKNCHRQNPATTCSWEYGARGQKWRATEWECFAPSAPPGF